MSVGPNTPIFISLGTLILCLLFISRQSYRFGVKETRMRDDINALKDSDKSQGENIRKLRETQNSINVLIGRIEVKIENMTKGFDELKEFLLSCKDKK